jgi:SagB-type dehydrogenase family enzyme
MSGNSSWTPQETWAALDAARARLEEERRESFKTFGIERDCLWPCSRLFHKHSALGPAWRPVLTVPEVDALTRDRGYRQYPHASRVALPDSAPMSADLERVIRARRSSCAFSGEPVALPVLAKLLSLADGVTSEDGLPRRAAPSGGALYPVETYVLAFGVAGLVPGVYHYQPLEHVLEHLCTLPGLESASGFLPPGLYEARPTIILALSAVFARTQIKYLERGYRFALLEAGHIAQNLLLCATALGLSSVPVGGFWDDPFNDLLGLDPSDEAVVYAVLVGCRAPSLVPG